MRTLQFGILWGVLFLIILFLSPCFVQAMEFDTDRQGMDYKSFDLPSTDPNLCERACKEDPQNCKAWTYVKPGIQGPKARCWLKSGVPRAVRNTSCISGIVQSPAKSEVGIGPVTKDVKVESGQAAILGSSSLTLNSVLTALVTPKITSVYSPVLKPEFDWLIWGSAFGYNPGQVKMTLPSGKTINLVVQQWLYGLLRVHVPPISGEKAGSVSIQVETADHLVSNKVSVNFEATRDITILPKSLVEGDCADPLGSVDDCMIWTHDYSAWSFAGGHLSHCCFTGDHDTDKFWTKGALQNGWIIHDVFIGKIAGGGEAHLKTFNGKGTPSMQVTVEWSDSLWDMADYSGVIQIIGPKGVPYQ